MFNVSETIEDLDNFLDDSFDFKSIENKNVTATSNEFNDLEKTKDVFQLSLDESEDDELILSVVESVDGSFLSNTSDRDFVENTATIQASRKENTEKSAQKSFFDNNSILNRSGKFSITASKHKLLVTDSPIVKSPKVEYERKFPGPAGLIIKNSKKNVLLRNENYETTSNEQSETLSTSCSPFENDAWQKLRSDLENQSSELLRIVDKNIIDEVKRMNIIKHTSRKIPLFAAVIFHLDPSVSDPSVVLKDPSGDIHGAVHKDFWELHSHLLTVGSALLLKHVSVLSILNSRKLYLNITSSNVVSIYTPRTDGDPLLITHLTSISILDCTDENKTANITSKENTSSNKLGSKTKSTSRCDDDLIKILKHSNSSSTSLPDLSNATTLSKSNAESRISNSPNVTKLDNVLPKPQFSSFLLIPSAEDLHATVNKHDLNSRIVQSELEGIDTDCLFDDF